MGVSDIHTAPEKDHIRLEIRLHGILQELSPIAKAVYQDYSRRIKFLSKLKLNITNVPQDGQYTFESTDEDGKRTVNVRVATIPSRFGEKITLRLLDPVRGIKPLSELGFPEAIYQKLSELIQLPNGLILVTGPTGSGKTTTLYALLSTIIGKQRNIITLEDPIEYEIAGIVQSEVDPDHDFTFASGLRSILRHDPDVVLIGEIRDLETAQTAVDASLTGHLVLGTLHTNSAVEAIPRLLSMGVSPYTFAPSLRAILGQRLIRTLSEEAKKDIEHCDPLNQDIFAGRRSIPELMVITPPLRELILEQERESVVLEEAKKEGYMTMKQWGERWIEEGVTLREEIERVTM